MATIKIVKFKLRRGTDAQRRATVLNQGEMGYTTDTSRVFVGTGTLSGGNVVGSKVFPPVSNIASLVSINAEVGDLVLANNIYYQLTASDYTNANSWRNVGPKLDSVYLEYTGTNSITIKSGSITPDRLSAANVNNGLTINSNNLQVDYNTTHFEISSNKLTLNDAGVTERELAASTFTNGITGGSGGKVGLKVDGTSIGLDGSDALRVLSVPSDSITFTSLDSDWIGPGLIYDLPNQLIKATLTNVDNISLTKDLSGVVSMQSGASEGDNEWPFISVDTYGRVYYNASSIYDTVSCIPGDSSSPLSALFVGTPSQSLSGLGGLGDIANFQVTTFTVISSNSTGSTNLTLSSAGFLMFEGNTFARQDSKYVGRFAIPIFVY